MGYRTAQYWIGIGRPAAAAAYGGSSIPAPISRAPGACITHGSNASAPQRPVQCGISPRSGAGLCATAPACITDTKAPASIGSTTGAAGKTAAGTPFGPKVTTGTATTRY